MYYASQGQQQQQHGQWQQQQQQPPFDSHWDIPSPSKRQRTDVPKNDEKVKRDAEAAKAKEEQAKLAAEKAKEKPVKLDAEPTFEELVKAKVIQVVVSL